MIGVYLGFVVSNWAERSKKRKQSKALVANLLLEVQTNREQLNAVINYHEMLRDSSRHYAYSGQKLTNHDFFNGLMGQNLSNSAYETGIQTGTINELPLGEIQTINQLYTFQETYNDYGTLMLSKFLSLDFTEKEEDLQRILRFLALTMTDMVNMETHLISLYEKLPWQFLDRKSVV